MPRYLAQALCGGVALLLGLGGCVEPYVPAVLDAPTSFLVVDGFINGNGVTTVLLSRTSSLTATTPPPVEKGAKLFIVDDAGVRYALTERTGGTYQSDSLLLTAARNYQLRIITTNAATYASALVPLKVTPPIDNLAWKRYGDQVTISLSTHDPAGQTRYYRWGLAETWQFNSAYPSLIEYDPVKKIIVARTTPIYTCWRTERPTTIKQGSSVQLSQDALTDVALLTLSGHDERFIVRYSLLVREYAETAAEFAYYELLRKNTEAVGSVNDPLPTQLTGNVHRIDNASEPVLGFVSAHTVQQKRLFIDRTALALPGAWHFTTPYTSCTIDSLAETLFPYDRRGVTYPRTLVFSSDLTVPLDVRLDPATGDKMGYIGSSRDCVDCRARGSNVKPNFW